MNVSSHLCEIHSVLKLFFKRNHMGSSRKTANSSSVMWQESGPGYDRDGGISALICEERVSVLLKQKNKLSNKCGQIKNKSEVYGQAYKTSVWGKISHNCSVKAFPAWRVWLQPEVLRKQTVHRGVVSCVTWTWPLPRSCPISGRSRICFILNCPLMFRHEWILTVKHSNWSRLAGEATTPWCDWESNSASFSSEKKLCEDIWTTKSVTKCGWWRTRTFQTFGKRGVNLTFSNKSVWSNRRKAGFVLLLQPPTRGRCRRFGLTCWISQTSSQWL